MSLFKVVRCVACDGVCYAAIPCLACDIDKQWFRDRGYVINLECVCGDTEESLRAQFEEGP